jgi:hypothetical protein
MLVVLLASDDPRTSWSFQSGRVESRETPPGSGISRPTRSCLGGGGSRQCAVESYIFGSQPCVQKGTSSRGSRGEKPQDVIAQTQVSRKVEGPTVKEGAGIVEGETGRWSDVSHPRGARFAREEREGIGGENERKSLTGYEGM